MCIYIYLYIRIYIYLYMYIHIFIYTYIYIISSPLVVSTRFHLTHTHDSRPTDEYNVIWKNENRILLWSCCCLMDVNIANTLWVFTPDLQLSQNLCWDGISCTRCFRIQVPSHDSPLLLTYSFLPECEYLHVFEGANVYCCDATSSVSASSIGIWIWSRREKIRPFRLVRSGVFTLWNLFYRFSAWLISVFWLQRTLFLPWFMCCHSHLVPGVEGTFGLPGTMT